MDLYPNVDAAIWLRTCKQEVVKPLESIAASGEIPKWLSGKLFRNGPGASKVGELQFQHLFDNFGLVHCFTIECGEVAYQCRFVKSDYYQKISNNKVLITDFGTKSTNDPCNTIFHRVRSLFDPSKSSSDNAMITIYPFRDEIYAFGEAPFIHRINKSTLETEKRENLFKNIGIVNHSAHPHIMNDGSVINIGMTRKSGIITHCIVEFPSSDNMFDKARIISSIPTRKYLHPSYMHSFGITRNYFILVQQPLSVSILELAKNKLRNEPLISALQWDKKRETRFDIICRLSGKLIKSVYTEGFFFLHVINQYERNDNEIVIDICCYETPEMINLMYTEALENMQRNPDYAKLFRGRPKRFVIFLREMRVYPRLLCNLGCETPQINYAMNCGKFYRYFYAINSDVDVRYPGTIIKVDVETGHTLTWCEDNCYPSEPIFVPREPSIGEDDGVLLSSLVWGRRATNYVGLLVLNAKNMKEIGRRVFNTPSEVPKCLHGWYMSKQKGELFQGEVNNKRRKL